MKVYIVAAIGGVYMHPVSKVYKTYSGAKKFMEFYTKDIKDKSSYKILVADNWHEAKE